MSETRERKFGRLSLRILRDQCIGTGACNTVMPDVLDFDSRQTIDFTEDPPSEVERERLEEACQVCPVEALELYEDGRKVAP